MSQDRILDLLRQVQSGGTITAEDEATLQREGLVDVIETYPVTVELTLRGKRMVRESEPVQGDARDAEHLRTTVSAMKRHAADALRALAAGRTVDASGCLFALCALLPQPTDADLPLPEAFWGSGLTAERAMEVARGIVPKWAAGPDVLANAITDALLFAASGKPGASSDPLPNPLLVPLTRYADALDAVARQEGCGEGTRAKLEGAALLVRSAVGVEPGERSDKSPADRPLLPILTRGDADRGDAWIDVVRERLPPAPVAPPMPTTIHEALHMLAYGDRGVIDRPAIVAFVDDCIRRIAALPDYAASAAMPATLTREDAERWLTDLSPTAVRHLDTAREWLASYALSTYRDSQRDEMAAILRAYVAGQSATLTPEPAAERGSEVDHVAGCVEDIWRGALGRARALIGDPPPALSAPTQPGTETLGTYGQEANDAVRSDESSKGSRGPKTRDAGAHVQVRADDLGERVRGPQAGLPGVARVGEGERGGHPAQGGPVDAPTRPGEAPIGEDERAQARRWARTYEGGALWWVFDAEQRADRIADMLPMVREARAEIAAIVAEIPSSVIEYPSIPERVRLLANIWRHARDGWTEARAEIDRLRSTSAPLTEAAIGVVSAWDTRAKDGQPVPGGMLLIGNAIERLRNEIRLGGSGTALLSEEERPGPWERAAREGLGSLLAKIDEDDAPPATTSPPTCAPRRTEVASDHSG